MYEVMTNSGKLTRLMAFLAAVMMIVVSGGTIETNAAASGFYVSGTQIYDANGNQFVMRGVNVAHAWYTSQTQTSIKAIAAAGANTVRVVVSDGQKYSKTSQSELNNIVSLCKQNKLVCILEVHDATGSDSTYDLDQAVNYWINNKSVLQGNEKYVILNIANEWYGTWDGYSWAEGNKSAIQKIRNAGISNLLMIDCAGWGQYPDSIRYYGKSVFNADSQKNTVFSIHMYEYAGGSSGVVKSNIDNALGIGVPVVIGEFAAQHTNGDVDEATIMSYCTQKKVGYLGWSWKGNDSYMSYLDIAYNWDGSSLSSWGNTLINGSNGIKQTSKLCSVYTGSSSSSTGSSNSSNSSVSSTSASSSGDSYISLFWGEKSSAAWGQPVSVMTSKNGGSFNASNIKRGGYFYIEYSGEKKQIELCLQSWSGGASWAKVSATEHGSANGHYYAKFSYDACVKAFGTSDFAGKLDQIHAGAQGSYTTVYSVCYCQPSSATSTSNTSTSSSSSTNTSSSSSTNTSSSSTSTADAYVSLFWGQKTASPWAQAVSVMTTKNGGSFNAANIKSGGYFYVEYTGKQKQIELVLQSWSGGSSWAKVSATEHGSANGHYYAKFSYDACVKAFGTSDFAGKLDQIHASCMKNTTTVYSVCYCYR